KTKHFLSGPTRDSTSKTELYYLTQLAAQGQDQTTFRLGPPARNSHEVCPKKPNRNHKELPTRSPPYSHEGPASALLPAPLEFASPESPLSPYVPRGRTSERHLPPKNRRARRFLPRWSETPV